MAARDSVLRLKAVWIAQRLRPVIAPPLCSLGGQPTQRCTYIGVCSVFKVRVMQLRQWRIGRCHKKLS